MVGKISREATFTATRLLFMGSHVFKILIVLQSEFYILQRPTLIDDTRHHYLSMFIHGKVFFTLILYYNETMFIHGKFQLNSHFQTANSYHPYHQSQEHHHLVGHKYIMLSVFVNSIVRHVGLESIFLCRT